jgi:enoyl-CoA hydratase/carnithine racemase
MAATVAQLAQEIQALAPLALQLTKQSINDISQGTADGPTLRAREALTASSRDFAEGRQAFAEKRPPRFTGT